MRAVVDLSRALDDVGIGRIASATSMSASPISDVTLRRTIG
jgi:hypothetical protein